jgi:hypothetical protein
MMVKDILTQIEKLEDGHMVGLLDLKELATAYRQLESERDKLRENARAMIITLLEHETKLDNYELGWNAALKQLLGFPTETAALTK